MALLLTHYVLSQTGEKVIKKAASKNSDKMVIRDLAKKGWQGGKDIKAKPGELLHRGKNTPTRTEQAQSHSSAPLSTLKDPASFGPPPQHVNRAPVNSTGPAPGSFSTPKSYDTVGRNAFPESKVLATAPPAGSWGAPLSSEVVQEISHADEAEEEKPKAPPVPYRADRTGVNTANLPKPPTFRGEIPSEGAAPPPTAQRPLYAQTQKPAPPPRLPVRQNSRPDEYSPAPPPPYTDVQQSSAQPQPGPGYLNKGSLNRLGQAGVSIPGFGIGQTASPEHGAPISPTAQQPTAPASSAQLSELQSRFSKLPGRVSSPPTQTAQQSGGGTTWAQKQSALSTASKFHKDPSSVSFSDAREAGSTVNNFRQRHGDQVATGLKQAQSYDQQYGVTGKVGGWAQGQQQDQPAGTVPAPRAGTSSTPVNLNAIGKKAPPPPPKKKELSGLPPPIPISSKPRG